MSKFQNPREQNNKFLPTASLTTVKKDVRYFKIPFVGHFSFTIRKQLVNALKNNFPQIDIRIVFSNDLTISSLLKKKERKTV